jgi:hypothetical protein
MKNARTLALKRESLTALTGDELAVVVGGTHLCVTGTCGHGATFDTPCAIPTTPVNNCPTVDNACPNTQR